MEKQKFDGVKYIPFLYIQTTYFGWKQDKEEAFIKVISQTTYNKVYYVSKRELILPNDSNRVMCILPSVASYRTEADLKKHAAFPKFNFGIFYELDKLYLVDDIIEYGYYRTKYNEIRTALDIRKSLLKTP